MMKLMMIKCCYQDIILSFVNSLLYLFQEFIFENDTSLDGPLRVHSIFCMEIDSSLDGLLAWK